MWAAAVIHGAALALDLGLAVSRPWLNDVLSKATQRLLSASRSRGSGPCSGVLRPRNLCCPLLDPPLRDGLRGGFLDLENGAIWPLNGLRAKKIPRFQDQGLDPDPRGGRVNARNEKTRREAGSSKPLVVEHLGLLVTASGGSSYRNTLSV